MGHLCNRHFTIALNRSFTAANIVPLAPSYWSWLYYSLLPLTVCNWTAFLYPTPPTLLATCRATVKPHAAIRTTGRAVPTATMRPQGPMSYEADTAVETNMPQVFDKG